MAEKSTVARPYAQAAFELAQEGKALEQWSVMLNLAALVAEDESMQALIGNPNLAKERLVQLFLDVCGDALNATGQNFIRVLGENNRLALLPEIAELFEGLRGEAEGAIEAEVISAYPLNDAQQQQLVEMLKQRLGKAVTLNVKVDESLIGGVVIRAGDLVIDGSAAGKLTRLANALMH